MLRGETQVRFSAPTPDGPWYIQCRTAADTVDATSLLYPTFQAADEALHRIGSLNVAT